jgi:hypothetical protein
MKESRGLKAPAFVLKVFRLTCEKKVFDVLHRVGA